MDFFFIIIWLLIGLTFVCSFFIAKKMYKKLIAQKNQYALALSVGIFVITLAVLGCTALFIVANTFGFGR